MHLIDILNWHLNHYPLLKAEDIYKLIFQCVFGPGHLLVDRAKEQENLNREIALALRAKIGAEVEPIDPDGLLVRVNLASIVGSATKTERLFQALVYTAQNFTPQPELLTSRLHTALKWCRSALPQETKRFQTIIGQPQHPPRHSVTYVKNYRPAYRVVFSWLWFSA